MRDRAAEQNVMDLSDTTALRVPQLDRSARQGQDLAVSIPRDQESAALECRSARDGVESGSPTLDTWTTGAFSLWR